MGVDAPSDRCAKDLYLEGGGAGKGEMTRREFISTVGVVTGGIALGVRVSSAIAIPSADASAKSTAPLELIVNGQKHHLMLDPRVTLLDLLREDLALTGTKKGCDHGQCGACTVLANGRRINSCLALAVSHEGEEITTIEGIARGEDLHPVQSAFIEHDGLQCGYCTPGQICSAVALLAEVQRGEVSFVTTDTIRDGEVELTDAEIRERMSGNICRCGAYSGIVAAIRAANLVGQASGRKQETER